MRPTVVPTSEVRTQLSQITRRFDEGDADPVVFGSHRRPQAVLVPIETWERLLAAADLEAAPATKADSEPTAAQPGASNPATRYADTRPYASPPTSLARLRGKARGVVRLPRHLDWGPGRSYQLDQDRQRRALYEVVVQEAADTDEIEKYVNGRLLLGDWRELRLPARVREAWEQQLPALAAKA